MLNRKIALGTVQFGVKYGVANQFGQMPFNDALSVISLAKKFGINTIDTAIGYGDSEEILGEIGTKSFQVVTKLPALPKYSMEVGDWVKSQIEGSCARLKTLTLYAVLLHRPADLLGCNGCSLLIALKRLKDDGAVEKIGVSIYDPDELDAVWSRMPIDLVQAPLNVIDRRLQSSGWLHRLKDSDVEVHTRSAFLQGLLLMNRSDIPEKFSRWACLWDQWHEQLNSSGITALSACLSFPQSLPEVDRVVVGVDNEEQLKSILAVSTEANHSLDTSFMVSTDAQLINPSKWAAL
jgi:aryl-alcohol dehydrogenase-like predicted oxidoreductase